MKSLLEKANKNPIRSYCFIANQSLSCQSNLKNARNAESTKILPNLLKRTFSSAAKVHYSLTQ